MSNTLTLGRLTANPGEKVQDFVGIPGTPVEVPATLIHGAKPGKRVAITGGTHGGEYPGVETAIRLAGAIDPAEVSGQIIILHPVNVPAFFARLQYIGPYDGKNLNRCYPGKATGTVTERMAHFVFSEVILGSDFYMDLHGGDIHEWLTPFVLFPMTGSSETANASLSAAHALGLPYIVGSHGKNGTIGSAAVAGVPGLLIEIGARGLWCEEEITLYREGVTRVLQHLEVLPGEPGEPVGNTTAMPRMIGLDAGVSGCWYPLVRPDDRVMAGQPIGEIRDLFGKTLETYTSPEEGVVLYVISSLPVEKGDPIAAVGPIAHNRLDMAYIGMVMYDLPGDKTE